MFTDSIFWQAVKVTLEYSLAVIVVALSVALGTALLMNRSFRGPQSLPGLVDHALGLP